VKEADKNIAAEREKPTMRNNYPFIVIEGIDGCGKTTAGKSLAGAIGAEFFQTPSGTWRKYRGIVENAHPILRFFYYLCATVCSSCELPGLLQDRPVVCDRYIYSTWCYHIVYGCNFLRRVDLHSAPVIWPDAVFFLYVNSAEREKRVSCRSNNTKKDMESDILEKVQSDFLKMKGMHIIDTSKLTPEGVLQAVLRTAGSSGKRIVDGRFN
jgi:thymidylate kinase